MNRLTKKEREHIIKAKIMADKELKRAMQHYYKSIIKNKSWNILLNPFHWRN